jgi:hypothetical protein
VEVEAFIAKLDDTFTPCPCCNKRTYNNWEDHLAITELTTVLARLRKWQDTYRLVDDGQPRA